MKALFVAFWTDPKVALGFATLIASSVGLLLTTAPVSVPIAIGTVLLNLTGGGVLLHSVSPWTTAPPEVAPGGLAPGASATPSQAPVPSPGPITKPADPPLPPKPQSK